MDTIEANLAKADAQTRKIYKRATTKRGRKSTEELAVIKQITGHAFTPKAPKAAAKAVKRAYTKNGGSVSEFNDFIRQFNADAPITVSQGNRKMILQQDAAQAVIVVAHDIVRSKQVIQDKLSSIIGG